MTNDNVLEIFLFHIYDFLTSSPVEFFVDGLGSLHVGSCDDIIINHASKIKAMLPWGQSETDQAYSKFRYPPASNTQNILFYFKNHFKCKTSN